MQIYLVVQGEVCAVLSFRTGSSKCWRIGKTDFHRDLCIQFSRSLSVWVFVVQCSSLCCYLGLFHSGCRTLSLLSFMKFLLAQSCSLSKSLWIVAHLSTLPSSSPHLVSSANLVKIDSIMLFRWLVKIVRSTGPSINHWEALFMTNSTASSALGH